MKFDFIQLHRLARAKTNALGSKFERVRWIGDIYIVVVLVDDFAVFKTRGAYRAK
jgi:hypothetical protein